MGLRLEAEPSLSMWDWRSIIAYSLYLVLLLCGAVRLSKRT